MAIIYSNDLPLMQRKLIKLIEQDTKGNVSAFAKKINCSQQMLDLCIKRDKTTGEYRTIFPSIKKAIMEAYGFNETWFYTEDESTENAVDNQGEQDFLSIIRSLTIANEKHAQANLLNAEANIKNANSIEKLLKMITKKEVESII